MTAATEAKWSCYLTAARRGQLATAKESGAQFTIHSQRQSVHDELQALTGGHGPDVIVEAIGLPRTFQMAVEEVAFTGRVVYVGYAKEPVSYETKLFVQRRAHASILRKALDASLVQTKHERLPSHEAKRLKQSPLSRSLTSLETRVRKPKGTAPRLRLGSLRSSLGCSGGESLGSDGKGRSRGER